MEADHAGVNGSLRATPKEKESAKGAARVVSLTWALFL